MGIPAGMLLQRIGYKKTALLAVTVGFIGVGITLSGIAGLPPFGGRFPVFPCMLNTVVNPMLNTLAGGGNKGNQLIQLGGSFNSISATIVPVLAGYSIADPGLRLKFPMPTPALFFTMGYFALAFVVLYFVNIPEPIS